MWFGCIIFRWDIAWLEALLEVVSSLSAVTHKLGLTQFCFFFLSMYRCFLVCLCVICAAGAPGGQRRVSEPLELELQVVCEPPCGCWEFNPGPLEEQPLDLNSELSLKNPFCNVKQWKKYFMIPVFSPM